MTAARPVAANNQRFDDVVFIFSPLDYGILSVSLGLHRKRGVVKIFYTIYDVFTVFLLIGQIRVS